MRYTSLFVVLILSLSTLKAAADESSEIESAKRATVRHNQAIEHQKQKLVNEIERAEAAIKRAREKYAREVIETKKQYVEQL